MIIVPGQNTKFNIIPLEDCTLYKLNIDFVIKE